MVKKSVKAEIKERVIPTYIPKPATDLPMFFEKKPYQGATGRLYPLLFSETLSDEKTEKSYQVITLENEYIKIDILPEIGGKVLRCFDKIAEDDFLYHNSVIKPAMVGLAGPWISGGIEFNWPQHHRPTTFMPLEYKIEKRPDGTKVAWVGEVEPFHRMKGMAGFTVCPGRSFLKAEIKVYNRTPYPQPFMWWANLAAPGNDNYKIIFPPDVEWVNDHDRRAVLSWPVAKGVYHTARPINYGEGTDLSHYSNIVVPSSFMVSEGQSDMDFVAGYDKVKHLGMVTVADHNIAPGKKLWHWGKGDFGDMWCSNLTDSDGPYVELMTGVFTDNQPDFTWIMPYESRTFEQFWYPVRDIGDVKNATIDAALNIERRGEQFFIGVQPTGSFTGAEVTVTYDGQILYQTTTNLVPEQAFICTFPANSKPLDEHLSVSVRANGKELVSFTPPVRGNKKPPEVRLPVERPKNIQSTEELFLNGIHLEQYKQHNYDPKDYYLEALRRDPNDSRCNTAMGRLALKNCDFEGCIRYSDTAIKRLTIRNQHPTDVEPFYNKALALKLLGRDEEAYKMFFKAAWHASHSMAAYYQLALLDCKKGDFASALTKTETSISLNTGNAQAKALKVAILRHSGKTNEAAILAKELIQADILDLRAYVELNLCGEANADEIRNLFGSKKEAFLDVVVDYLDAGFYEDALAVLKLPETEYPLYYYYKGYISGLLGNEQSVLEEYRIAEQQSISGCLPSRAEDILVLGSAIKANSTGDKAYYYLGCLYYDRFQYDKALELWNSAVTHNPNFGYAWRNLAIALFDKKHQADKAREAMERALELCPDCPRILYELQQILKNSNVSTEQRLAYYEKHYDLAIKRDDCYLDMITLHTTMGDFEKAIQMASNRTFHIYEGGEGKLTMQHAWIYLLYGDRLVAEGKVDEALAAYKGGTVIPKCYGEAKSHFAQESHLYLRMGDLYSVLGETEKANEAYCEAAANKSAVSEISAFRVIALKRLGEEITAAEVAQEMLNRAEHLLQNPDLYGYYGVGSPTPLPFEQDIVTLNTVNGRILKAFALAALGNTEQADREIEQAEVLRPYDFRIFAFKQVFLGK